MPYDYRSQCTGNQYPYVIQRGDTLYNIASRFGISVAHILSANPGINPSNLMIGDVLCIPVCPPNHFPQTIERGDTLYKLARTYNTAVEAILEANPGIDPSQLRVGQMICIPIRCDCYEITFAMQRDIDLLTIESATQQTAEANYGGSGATTAAVTVTDMLLQFDAVPVVFTDNYSGQFTQGSSYPYYISDVGGGRKALTVKDNFGVWHTFTYYA